MSDYRKEFREIEREYYWSLPRIIGGLFIGAILLGGIGWGVSLLSQPGRVITKTFDADNMINNYEFFYDANNQVKARVGQIQGHKTIIADNSDASEKPRLRIELGAMQQSCRDLVGKYNANAIKANRSIFKGTAAPDSLNPSICE